MTRDLCTAYECLNNYNIMCNETCFLFVLSLSDRRRWSDYWSACWHHCRNCRIIIGFLILFAISMAILIYMCHRRSAARRSRVNVEASEDMSHKEDKSTCQ